MSSKNPLFTSCFTSCDEVLHSEDGQAGCPSGFPLANIFSKTYFRKCRNFIAQVLIPGFFLSKFPATKEEHFKCVDSDLSFFFFFFFCWKANIMSPRVWYPSGFHEDWIFLNIAIKYTQNKTVIRMCNALVEPHDLHHWLLYSSHYTTMNFLAVNHDLTLWFARYRSPDQQ